VEITDPAGGKWTVVRQVGVWRRKSRAMWAVEVMPGGLGNDPVSAVIAIPFFALALILLALALALLFVAWPVALLLRAIRVTGSRIVVVNTVKLGEVGAKPGKARLRHGRFRVTVLEAGTMAGRVRVRDAVAEHVRRGGDVMDPVVGRWLAAERGRLVSHRTKPDPHPVKPETEPA
jgi:hypothetical protein